MRIHTHRPSFPDPFPYLPPSFPKFQEPLTCAHDNDTPSARALPRVLPLAPGPRRRPLLRRHENCLPVRPPRHPGRYA